MYSPTTCDIDQFGVFIKTLNPGARNLDDETLGCQATRINNKPDMPKELMMSITCVPWQLEHCDVGYWPEGKDPLFVKEVITSSRGLDATIICPRGYRMAVCGLSALVRSFDNINVDVGTSGRCCFNK